jgi:hypothetical protein
MSQVIRGFFHFVRYSLVTCHCFEAAYEVILLSLLKNSKLELPSHRQVIGTSLDPLLDVRAQCVLIVALDNPLPEIPTRTYN